MKTPAQARVDAATGKPYSVRPYSGTTRPPHVEWSEIWQGMSKEKKEREVAVHQLKLERAADAARSSAAAAAKTRASDVSVTLVEVCTSPDSLLGRVEYMSNASAVRVTLEHDFTTDKGVKMAIDGVDKAAKTGIGLAWFSLPCVGGCPVKHMNRKKPGGEDRLNCHVDLF